MFARAEQYLQQYFGYSSFREGQKQAIEHILTGNNTMCIMPTGGGKSICYQIPALVLEGTTIVISPLISLMKDQVDTLAQMGISATYINSSLSMGEANKRINRAIAGEFKLLYVAPERLEAWDFVEQLRHMTIPLIAIDEAHCISQWGHDFRPSYLNIATFIDKLVQRPKVLALTATATSQVREDICNHLGIAAEHTILTTFERDNLSFSVVKGEDNYRFLRNYVKKNEREVGIVYAATRKNVDQLFEQFQKEGISVAKYHAGLTNKERAMYQEEFLHDKVNVVVATSAFGMGIDKSNVRYVVHYQMPKNMESYYQEAGRAGRDGLPSECILLHGSQDVQVQRYLIEQSADHSRMAKELEKLQGMVDYCHTEGCLQSFILEYFGETGKENCGRCGNCTDIRESVDVTADAQKVLSCIIRTKERFGKTMIAQILTGSRNKKVLEFGFNTLSTFGLMEKQSVKDVNTFIEFLISGEYLEVIQGKFPTIKVSEKGRTVLLGKETVTRKQQVETKEIVQKNPLFEALRTLRREIAGEEHVPPFVIFSDQTLQDICVKLPRNMDDLLFIKGIGEQKKNKYGERVLSVIRSFGEEEEVSPFVKLQEVKEKTLPTYMVSTQMFQEGKTIEEIAIERELTRPTIESHLLKAGSKGVLDLQELIPREYEGLLLETWWKYGKVGLKAMKDELPEGVTSFVLEVFFVLVERKMRG